MDKNLTHPAYTAARNIFNRDGKVMLLNNGTCASTLIESPTVPPSHYYRDKLRDYFKAAPYGALEAYTVNQTPRTPIKTHTLNKPQKQRIELRELFWTGSGAMVEWDCDTQKPLRYNGSSVEWVQFINNLFWIAKLYNDPTFTARDAYLAFITATNTQL